MSSLNKRVFSNQNQLNSCPCRNCKSGGNNFVKLQNTIPESCNLNAFDPNMPCSEIRTTKS